MRRLSTIVIALFIALLAVAAYAQYNNTTTPTNTNNQTNTANQPNTTNQTDTTNQTNVTTPNSSTNLAPANGSMTSSQQNNNTNNMNNTTGTTTGTTTGSTMSGSGNDMSDMGSGHRSSRGSRHHRRMKKE